MPVLKRIGGQLFRYAGHLVFIVLIPILSFLFTRYGSSMRAGLYEWLDGVNRGFWRNVICDLDKFIAHYVRAVLLMSLATFLAYGGFLSLVRVRYGLVLAGTAGLLELIPLVGPLTAAVLVLGMAVFSGFPHLLWLVLFLICYRLFQDYVLNPLLMSSAAQLNPVAVIFGVLAGEQLAGVPGVLLAIPVLGTVKIFAIRSREHLGHKSETKTIVSSGTTRP
jgi:predicted PurR-regulated permease PerM